MRVYGLTGGIASGKSTVTRFFQELGVPVVDADVVARELVEPGTVGLAAVAARFPGVLGADGRLDRKALGARVFGDAGEREALNALLHPQIAAAVLEHTRALAAEGHPVILYDAALLIENGHHRALDGVILVVVPEAVQLARLCARDGLSKAEARLRLGAQLPLKQKRVHATFVVDNSGSLEDTRAQVNAVWRQLSAPESP